VAEKREHRNYFKVEPLAKAHGRPAFSCGIEALDNYLKKQASQDVTKRAAVCFVLTPDGKTVAGFYTLSQYSVDLVKLPKDIATKLPKYPEVPATLLGRLAISTEFRGQKLGEFLLLDALHRSLQQSRQVASTAVIADAKDEAATRFYLHFDFVPLPDIQNRLFLPMQAIGKLFPEG
jgi:predicted GNAT family N-acyltransferase